MIAPETPQLSNRTCSGEISQGPWTSGETLSEDTRIGTCYTTGRQDRAWVVQHTMPSRSDDGMPDCSAAHLPSFSVPVPCDLYHWTQGTRAGK